MSQTVVVEACVDSIASALAAQEGGARRIELCADLLEGGCTPSAGTIQLVRKLLSIRVHVIIRPRGGDFCYSDTEFAAMQADIAFCKQTGVDGVVIGILNPDGTVDVGRTRTLIELARPMSVTFHRAFDVTRDPFEALETLIQLGIDRVLTTGQEAYVLEGLDLIGRLVKVADKRISIMPGGITERNLGRVLAETGVTEIHTYLGQMVDSAMKYHNQRVFMGGTLRPPEYAISITTREQIHAVVQQTA
jgi:copper homeostasis protein